MTWISPLYALVAAAIAVPSLIILYFLKLRRRDLEISTTLLWKKAIQDLQANAPFQKLRRNLLLFLQLLVLAGIIAALGQPQIKGQDVKGSRHVILIDRSGSMASLDEDDGRGGKMTRLEAGKKQAIALIESLSEGNVFNKTNADEAMVIAFDTAAEVREPFTSDKQGLRAAIEAITQTDGPTSVEEAMRLAKAHAPKRVVQVEGKTVSGLDLPGGEGVTLDIYSDGLLPDADKALPGPDDDVQYHKLGKPDSTNMGIVGLRSERNYDDPTKLSVFVALENSDKDARVVDVELTIDGVVAGIKPASVPGSTSEGPELSAPTAAQAAAREREAAGVIGAPTPDKAVAEAQRQRPRPGVGGVVFQLDRGEGALVQVRLRNSGTSEPVAGDVLAMDDRAWIVVPPAKKMAVALVGRGDLFIESALSGLPLSRLTPMTPEQFETAAREGKMSEYDVVLLNGWVPAPATPPQAPAAAPAAAPAGAPQPTPVMKAAPNLPTGRYLILGAVPGNSGIIDKGKGGTASIVDWNRDHPVLRSINLGEMAIGESRLVDTPNGGGAEVMGMSDVGPMMIEVTSADVHEIVIPFDVANSDWPFKPGFVVFLASAINYLGEDGAGPGGRMVQPGAVLADRVPSGVTNVAIELPNGDSHSLTPATDGRIVYGPLPTTGIYKVSWDGTPGPTDVVSGKHVTRAYAANLLDAAESDVGSAPTIALASKEIAAQAGKATIANKKLWPWMLLAALGVVMLEWFIYNRKVYL